MDVQSPKQRSAGRRRFVQRALTLLSAVWGGRGCDTKTTASFYLA